jgi:ATP-dependent protease Clp ATPase subunit
MTCTFCGSPRESVSALVAGPGVYICDTCLAFARSVIAEADEVVPSTGSAEGTSTVGLRCSFCAVTTQEVRRMIAGPDVRICGECVAMASDAVANAAH